MGFQIEVVKFEVGDLEESATGVEEHHDQRGVSTQRIRCPTPRFEGTREGVDHRDFILVEPRG
jgi:hypothetical protein